MRRFLVAVVAMLCVAAPLRAEDLTGRFAAGGAVGGGVPLGTKWVRDHADIGPVLGGFLRYGIDKNWSVGLSYDNVGFDKGVRVQPVLANAYYNLLPDSRFNPNIHAGLGASDVRRDEQDRHTAFTGKLGVGADYFFHKNVAVGGFLDYLPVWRKSTERHEIHGLLFGLTLAYWFDPCGCKKAPQAAAPAPRPAPAPVVAAPPPPAPKEKVSIQLLIEFDTAKSVVKTQYDDQLKKVSDFLRDYPGTAAEIEGHTDSMGSHDYNMNLSQERADAVRQALISRFGVAADRLTAKGYGPTKPLADNGTPEGRAQNRRVLAVFSGLK